ncbi:hypothetical protein L6R49_12790 [Myxococcota bacterium]|nr:hypothetical protein [Myxococcota bacterium]
MTFGVQPDRADLRLSAALSEHLASWFVTPTRRPARRAAAPARADGLTPG